MANSAATHLMRFFLTGLLAGLILFALASRTNAQDTTASITGVVQDKSGAAVPTVTIKAAEQSTGFVRSTVSDTDGRYNLFDLPMGTYVVTAELKGFKTFRNDAFGPLTANQIARLDIEMVVGTVNERIEVLSTAPMLQTESSAVQTAITQDQIENLPLNSRSPVELLLQQPGIQTTYFFGTYNVYPGLELQRTKLHWLLL